MKNSISLQTTRNRTSAITLAAVALCLVAASASAVTWDGGAATTNWGDALNWSNDLVPTNGTEVTLDAAAPLNISLANTGRPVDNLIFAATAASPITLSNTGTSGLISLGSGDRINVDAGSANHTIARTSTTRPSSINVNGVSTQVLTSTLHIFGSDLSGTNTNIFTKGGSGIYRVSTVQNGGQSRGLISITGGTLDLRTGLTVGDNLAQNHTQLLSGSAGATLTNGAGGAVTFAFGRNSGRTTADALDQTYAGQITGQVNFQLGHTATLSGANATNFTGTQTLSGDNTYTGTTVVNQGTLIVNGTTSGQGNYTVRGTTAGATAKAGTLGGTGSIGLANNATFTIGGTQVAGSMGVLRPGADGSDTALLTLGTLGNNNSVIFGDASALRLDIGSATLSDRLAINGAVNLDSTLDTLDLLTLSGAGDGSTYTVATFTGALSGTFNTVQVNGVAVGDPGNFLLGSQNYQVVYGGNAILLQVVPEPSACALIFSSVGILFGFRRYRRSQPAAGFPLTSK